MEQGDPFKIQSAFSIAGMERCNIILWVWKSLATDFIPMGLNPCAITRRVIVCLPIMVTSSASWWRLEPKFPSFCGWWNLQTIGIELIFFFWNCSSGLKTFGLKWHDNQIPMFLSEVPYSSCSTCNNNKCHHVDTFYLWQSKSWNTQQNMPRTSSFCIFEFASLDCLRFFLRHGAGEAKCAEAGELMEGAADTKHARRASEDAASKGWSFAGTGKGKISGQDIVVIHLRFGSGAKWRLRLWTGSEGFIRIWLRSRDAGEWEGQRREGQLFGPHVQQPLEAKLSMEKGIVGRVVGNKFQKGTRTQKVQKKTERKEAKKDDWENLVTMMRSGMVSAKLRSDLREKKWNGRRIQWHDTWHAAVWFASFFCHRQWQSFFWARNSWPLQGRRVDRWEGLEARTTTLMCAPAHASELGNLSWRW